MLQAHRPGWLTSPIQVTTKPTELWARRPWSPHFRFVPFLPNWKEKEARWSRDTGAQLCPPHMLGLHIWASTLTPLPNTSNAP